MCSFIIYTPPVSKKDSKQDSLSPVTPQMPVTVTEPDRAPSPGANRIQTVEEGGGGTVLYVEGKAGMLPFGRAQQEKARD